MSFALGVFDVFTCVVTGSTYLSVLVYVLHRLGEWPAAWVGDANTTILLLGVLAVSYLIGHVVYRLGSVSDRIGPGGKRGAGPPLNRFVERTPTDRARSLIAVHHLLLLGAVEIHAREAAQEINRLRALGLTMRNAAPVAAIASLISLVEVFASGRPLLALGAAVIFSFVAWALVLRGRDLRDWAVLKTLELAYWIPQIDPGFAQGASDGA